jgi:ceramide glucosyltransferase
MYLAMNALAVDSCVMGKSNMWRKSDLEQVPDSFFAVGLDGSREEDPEGALGSPAFQVGLQSSQARPFVLGDDADEEAAVTAEEDEESLSILRQARPLARFSIYLAEDNMVALSLWRPPLSLSHVLASGSACIARTNVGEIRTLADYIGRRSRWIRVRRYMVPEATAVEPLTESLLAGVVGLSSLRYFGFWPSGILAAVLFFLVHFAGWYAVDFAVLHALESGSGDCPQQADEQGSAYHAGTEAQYAKQSPPSPLFTRKGERWEFTKAWMLREALALPIWCWAIWGGNEGEYFPSHTCLPYLIVCSLDRFLCFSTT